MPLRNAGASELATVLVVRKKDDHNKKTSHLILEMSMNEAFIWLSGHRIIDREIFIPEAKGLSDVVFFRTLKNLIK